MSREVRFRRAARTDVIEAQGWYEAQRAGLGREFREELDRIVVQIGSMPRMYPAGYRGLRFAVLWRFPYVVYFNETTDPILVVACLHGHRSRDILPTRVHEP